MPVFLRPPENCAGAGIGALQLSRNEDGTVEIPDGVDYSELLNHGFTPVSEADLAPIRLKKIAEDEARIEAEVERRLAARMGCISAQAPAKGAAPEEPPAKDAVAAQEPPQEDAPAAEVKEAAAAKPKK
jgi:hypothetical protein